MDPSLPFSELKNIRTLLSSGFLSDLQPGQAVYFTGFRTSPFDARKTNNALIDEALVSDDHNLCGQIRMVQLMVNLEKDRDEIRDEFDRSISLWLRLTGIRKRTRARFNDFKVYLRVYDLKAQKELSVTKIAKKIYGAGKDDESTMRKVKRQLQDAKKLIEGGYRHLR